MNGKNTVAMICLKIPAFMGMAVDGWIVLLLRKQNKKQILQCAFSPATKTGNEIPDIYFNMKDSRT